MARLLYIIGQLRAGGSERQLVYLLRSLDRLRYPSAVFVWNFDPDEVYAGVLREINVPVHGISPVASTIAKLRELRAVARRLRPEIVHSFSFFTNFSAHLTARACGAIAIGSLRSDLGRARLTTGLLFSALSLRWPNVLVCNSQAAAKEVTAIRSPFRPRLAHVVRNAIDLEAFSPQPFPASDSPPKIAAIGSASPVKRWEVLIEAAARLRDHPSSFRVELAGEGPLLEYLRRLAEMRQASERIRMCGHASDIPHLLGSSLFSVFCSESEGCPNAVMESMAAGRAVLATPVGDVPDLVEEGVTGHLSPVGNSEALASRMASLLENRERCRAMGEAAREKAIRAFGPHNMAEAMLAVYRQAGWCGA